MIEWCNLEIGEDRWREVVKTGGMERGEGKGRQVERGVYKT